jgi:hypothetical protein
VQLLPSHDAPGAATRQTHDSHRRCGGL